MANNVRVIPPHPQAYQLIISTKKKLIANESLANKKRIMQATAHTPKAIIAHTFPSTLTGSV